MISIIYPFKTEDKKVGVFFTSVVSSFLVDVSVLKCEAHVAVIVGVLQY